MGTMSKMFERKRNMKTALYVFAIIVILAICVVFACYAVWFGLQLVVLILDLTYRASGGAI